MYQATVFIAYCGDKWCAGPSPEYAIAQLRETDVSGPIQVVSALVPLADPIPIVEPSSPRLQLAPAPSNVVPLRRS